MLIYPNAVSSKNNLWIHHHRREIAMPNQCLAIYTRYLGVQRYQDCYQAMRHFTVNRHLATVDELWFVQHPPIFTLGKAGKQKHILKKGDIPIIGTDRGGQVTYHGLGQLLCYCLFDLKRRHLNIRQLIDIIEASIMQLLHQYGIASHRVAKQPGVYVKHAKIAALGLHIHRSCSYHGFSFNIAMDLKPFSYIRPCGIENLAITQLKDLMSPESVLNMDQIATDLDVIMRDQLQSITSNRHRLNQN